MSDIIFWGTLVLLAATTAWTVWRTKGQLTLISLLPICWMLIIPTSVLFHPFVESDTFPAGFVGAPRDNMYIAIGIANVAFAAYQWFMWSPWFARLQGFVVTLLSPRQARPRPGTGIPTKPRRDPEPPF